MLSLLHIGCTRVLDTAIADQRKRYAAERIDFHTYFPFKTIRDIQRILREPPSEDDYEYDDEDEGSADRRSIAVQDLLRAQQESPHKLWTLLLVQAFEPLLIRRRRALSTEDDAVLDSLVAETFVNATQDIPYQVCDPRPYVVDLSRRRLAKAMRQYRRKHATSVPAPSPSGVPPVGVCEDDDAMPPEVA